jgi:RNA polymerase sigma-32 factor
LEEDSGIGYVERKSAQTPSGVQDQGVPDRDAPDPDVPDPDEPESDNPDPGSQDSDVPEIPEDGEEPYALEAMGGESEGGYGAANLPVPAEDPHAKTPAPWRGGGAAASPEGRDSLRAYLNEIRSFKILAPEEEKALVREYIRTGNPEAGRRLVTANLRLVVKLAMEYQSSWLNNLQDLIQEGNMGLLQALVKFDPSKNAKFSYYASYWIRAYILKYIMDNWRLVKVGTTQVQRKLFYNLKKAQDQLVREGFEPVPELLAERLNVPVSEVEEMDARLSSGREVSLDARLGEDKDDTQVSMLQAPGEGADSILADAQIRSLVKDRLGRLKKTLDDRERRILEKRLLAEEPVTLQEIGEEFGVSRERVRQLEERLKKKIHAYLLKELPELSLSE